MLTSSPGCQSNAYSNNFLVFPDGHQLECSNTTIGTDGNIVTAVWYVATHPSIISQD